jgi:hypothetical protein
VSTEAEPPSKLGFEVPAGVEAIIMRLLEKDPNERFQEALDVRDALEAELEALTGDQLTAAPHPDRAEQDRQARATTGTLLFDEVAADGGQALVDLEQIQRETAVYEQSDSLSGVEQEFEEDFFDDELDEDADDNSPSGRRMWPLIALVLIGGVAAAFVALGDRPDEPPPEPVVTHDADAEAAPVAAPSSEEIVAVEIASDRVARAINSGVDAIQSASPDATASTKSESKPKRTPSARSSAKKKKPTDALLPVLTQAGARRIIASHNSEITACFEKGLLRDADFGGLVEVRTVIASDGSVANVDVIKSTVDASDVESCIVERVKSWTFPETGDGRVKILTTPFRFQVPDVNKK